MGADMSKDNRSKSTQDRQPRKPRERSAQEFYATCLHCGNPFPVTDGVVTSNAAICDVCNGSD